MNWKNNLQVYIDPNLKNFAKEIYQKIESEFTKYGSSVLSSIDEIKDVDIPIILFVEKVLPVHDEYLKHDKNFLIKVDKPNLDLFEAQESSTQYYTFQISDDVVELVDDILFFAREYLKNKMNEMVNKSQKHLKSILSRKNIESSDKSQVWSMIDDLEAKLYGLSHSIDIVNMFNDVFTKENDLKVEISNLTETLSEERENYLPLKITDDEYFFLTWHDDTALETILILYSVLNECFTKQTFLFNSRNYRKRWERIYSLIPFPIAVFDQQGQLIINNKNFVRLNLSYKQCSEISESDQVKIKDIVYKMVRRNIQNFNEEFVFVPVNEFLALSQSPSSEELGIISSSIAHEINNPLAGILAALDYLLLDELTTEVSSELKDMKAGVLRCKKLVDTFLGFSQLRNKSFNLEEENIIEECLNRSLELIRFRLIENNIQLKINHIGKNKFQQKLNSHVFSMIMYLIFGDLVTNLSHQSLVLRSSQNKIEINLEEKGNELFFTLPHKLDLNPETLNSKLMLHLFDVTDFKMNLSENQLHLYR